MALEPLAWQPPRRIGRYAASPGRRYIMAGGMIHGGGGGKIGEVMVSTIGKFAHQSIMAVVAATVLRPPWGPIPTPGF